jgi:ABC-type lipoprotein release transport system permease subunit
MLGLLGPLAGLLVGMAVALTVSYYVIRLAVRDGVVDASRRIDADRVRSDLGLGPQRSPTAAALTECP